MKIVFQITQWLFHSYEEFCELNLTYFKIFGLFQMVNPYNRVSVFSQKIWMYFHAGITIFTGIHTALQLIGLFASNVSDYRYTMNTITHIGNWSIAALKFVTFAYNKKRLQWLFDVLRLDFLHVTKFKERKDILYDNAYRCNWFIILYVLSCLSTCAVWNIYPLAELIYFTAIKSGNSSYHPQNILDSWYPFDSSEMPIFYYIYVYEFVIYFYMLFAFCCYDSYLFSMFTMMTAQFQVLNESFSDIGYDRPIRGYDPHLDDLYLFRPEETIQNVREHLFKSITSESALDNLTLLKSESLLDSENRQRTVHMKGAEETQKAQEFLDNLIECIVDLQKANIYANELIEVYNDVIVFQVVVSVVTICLMAFQTVVYFSVVDDDEFTGTFQISKSLLYFACAFLLLLLSCMCSGDLNDARKEINVAFYNAHWHEFKLPRDVVRSVLFSMTCSQRTHVVEITHRFPVDLHTFSEISEVCFSYFTFLLNYYRKKGYQ